MSATDPTRIAADPTPGPGVASAGGVRAQLVMGHRGQRD